VFAGMAELDVQLIFVSARIAVNFVCAGRQGEVI
jgi:hypothetical protein